VAKTMEIAERVRAGEAKTFVPYTDLKTQAAEDRGLGAALGHRSRRVEKDAARRVLDPEREVRGPGRTEPHAVTRAGWSGAAAGRWRAEGRWLRARGAAIEAGTRSRMRNACWSVCAGLRRAPSLACDVGSPSTWWSIARVHAYRSSSRAMSSSRPLRVAPSMA